MSAEQVSKSQFNIDITCSQLMHAEQVLKSQFHILPAKKSCMLNRFESHYFIYHLQPNHAC